MYHPLVRRWAAAIGVLLVGTIATGALSCGSSREEKGLWQGDPVSVDLTGCGDYEPLVEFSKTGRYVCVDWHLLSGTHPRPRLVFSVDGQVVREALDAKGRFTGEYLAEFPAAWPRTSADVRPPVFQRKPGAVALFPYPEFVADAGQWVVDDDLTSGLRLVDPVKEGMGKRWTAESWRFSPVPERVWQLSLPSEVASVTEGGLYRIEGTAYWFLAYIGYKALILSADDGHIVATVDYNDYLGSVKDLIEDDTPGRFSTWKASFSPERAMLACGGWQGTQFIVISFADHNQGRLVHASMQALEPASRGGIWHVDQVQFTASGKYLVVEYEFSGRSTNVVEFRTEVYDTEGWREVWSLQSRKKRAVAVSGDGKHVAVIVNPDAPTALEIGEPALQHE
jgi:hypothetical protein